MPRPALVTLVPCLWLFACSEPAPPTPSAPAAAAVAPLNLDRFEPIVREQLERQRRRLDALTASGTGGEELGEAQGTLAMLYHAHQLVPAALVSYELAVANDPTDFRWPYFGGQAFFSEGRLDEATRAFRRALELDSQDLPARLSLGRALQAGGLFAEARRELEAVLVREPGNVLALFHLSQVAAEEGQIEEAVALAEKGLGLQPKAEPIVRSLAGLYGRLGQRDKAAALLTRPATDTILASDPRMSELAALAVSGRAYLDRGVAAFTERRWPEAEAAFRQALTGLPEDAEVHLNLGSALFQQNRSAEAEASFRRALELKPDLAKGHFNLGTLLAAAGKRDEAIRSYERALELEPGDLGARFNLGNALLSLGRFAAADAAFAAVLAKEPARSPARLGRSVALGRLGRDAEARQVLEEGLQGQPNDAQLLHGLARLLAASPDAAVRDGARALALAQRLTGQSSALEHAVALAMAQAENGRFTEAATLQRRALEAVRQSGRRQDLLPSLDATLKLYEAGKPCRTPWVGADFGGTWR